MYQPGINNVLVLIDDQEERWGKGNDESMLGKSYSRGRVVAVTDTLLPTRDYPDVSRVNLAGLVGKDIIWNEGDEAGTLFEDDGKQFAFVYWYSIRAIKADNEQQASPF